MKKYLFFLGAFLLLAMGSWAQVSTYNFASTSGTYTPLATETVLWSGYGGFDDNVSASITIPGFTMSGITYTNMYVCANGFITLGTTAVPSGWYPISGTEAYDKALAPFFYDLYPAESGTPQISYNTNVNGEIVIQWQDVRIYGTTGDRLSFQLRLYPPSGTIRFVYGGTITGTNAFYLQVGLRGATNADFNNRTTATDWSATTPGSTNDATCTFSSTVLPAAGLTFTYSSCNPISGCNPITTFPFKESFDGTTFAPTCWLNQNTVNTLGGSGTWDRLTSGVIPTCTPHSGAAMACFDSYDYYYGTTGILVTPQLALPSDQYEVHFWMYRDDFYWDDNSLVNVYYNTCPNTTGAILLGTIHRYYTGSPAEATANQWYEYAFNMPAGSSGNAYIVFEGVSGFWGMIYIDDVKVKAIFNCPPGSIAEQEPCGQHLNDGCNMEPPTFEPISMGETKCGTIEYNGSDDFDSDWYIFTLDQQTSVTLTAKAESPLLIGFTDSPCPQPYLLYANYTLTPNTIISVTATLPAGTYYTFVGNYYTAFYCGEENRYWAKLTCPSCLVETFPFNESFDGTTFAPTCWLNQNTVNTGQRGGPPGIWDRQTSGNAPDFGAPHSGAGMARFDGYDYFPGTTGILVTPQLALTSDQYEVRFWMYRAEWWGSNNGLVNVYYNTFPTTTDATLLGTVHWYYGFSPPEGTANQWYEYVFNMPAGSSGNAYIVFEGVADEWANLFIDDVKVQASFICPPGSTAEQEPCGQNLNGGCYSSPTAYEPISLGETKCGTAWCDGNIRDVDYYIFTLTETTDVTFTASAEFPVAIWFHNMSYCAPWNDFIAYNDGAGVPPISITSTLPAGNYSATVTPRDWSTIITCGGADKYWAKLTCPACFVETFPFNESFDGTTFAPTCWLNQNTVFTGSDWGTGIWDRVTSGSDPPCPTHSGAAMARFDSWDYYNGTTGILVTPRLALTSPSDQYIVHFWMYRDNGYNSGNDLVNVYYNTSPNTTGAILLGTIHRLYSLSPAVATPNQWYEYLYNLPAGYSNNTYIVFEGVSNYWGSIFIDDVQVERIIGVNTYVPSTIVSDEHSFCYDALQTIIVGGAPRTFVISSGGSATMIAGQNILYMPGTVVQSGGYMHGYIAPGGPFCETPPETKADTIEENEVPFVAETSFFKIYPNPTTGNFTLEQKGEKQFGNVKVEVYGMRGDKVLTAEMINEKKHVFSLSEMPVGLYFVKVVADDYAETVKLIKTR